MNTCQNNNLPTIIIGLLLKILCLPLTNLNKGKLYNKCTFLICKYLHSQCPSDHTLGEIKWSNNYMLVTIDSFTESVGPTVSVPSSPLEAFMLFFTQSLLQLIVDETNRYVETCMGGENYAKWTKVFIKELQAYLGFMIVMGIVKSPSLYDYWKNDPYYHYTSIADRISRDRFMDISRYLHFVNNVTLALPGTPQYDHLGKVRPILEFLNNKFLTLYNPNRDNSIDEAMIKFKGRSAMKQYVPKKHIKRGFNVWVRADSNNGFVCEYQVYCGKEKRSETGLESRVV